MCKSLKLMVLISLVSLLGVAGSASGAFFYAWTGAGGTGLWNDANNWDMGEVPPHLSGEVGLTDKTYGNLITIPDGYTADCTFGVDYGRILGPEWGMNLDIYGNLNYNWYIVPVSNVLYDPRGYVTMYGDSTVTGEGIAVGDSWWWHGGWQVTWTMNDESYVDINWMFIGGELNLNDNSVLDIQFGVTDPLPTTLMTIADNGKMILPDAFTATVKDWIARGILVGKGGSINIEEEGGRTIVFVPEPATIALLGLGGLALIRRKRS